MENIAVIVDYKGSGVSFNNEEHIKNLKLELKKHYITNFRPNQGPQSGGLLDSVVDIVLNMNLPEVIAGGVVYDVAKTFLKPLFSAFSKIENETEYWDYYKISFVFDDTKINIYGMDKMFTSKVSEILKAIFENYHLLIDEGNYPFEINVPIKRIEEDGKYKFVNEEALTDYEMSEYLGYWAISYNIGYDRKVFDVKEKKLMNTEWSHNY